MEGFIVGEILYGFCNGYFGRDSYENKHVESFGKDWVVCRDKDGIIHFAVFDETKPHYTLISTIKSENRTEPFWDMVDRWRTPEEY